MPPLLTLCDYVVQIHYKSLGQLDSAVATINSSSVMTYNLTALKKFVVYQIRMLAYTAVGDGVISSPAVNVRTFEDGTQLVISVLAVCNQWVSLSFQLGRL